MNKTRCYENEKEMVSPRFVFEPFGLLFSPVFGQPKAMGNLFL